LVWNGGGNEKGGFCLRQWCRQKAKTARYSYFLQPYLIIGLDFICVGCAQEFVLFDWESDRAKAPVGYGTHGRRKLGEPTGNPLKTKLI